MKNISLWASGEWQAKNEYTQEYVKFIEEVSNEINISFIKVKAHSDESIYNDLADDTAKSVIEEYKIKNGIAKEKKDRNSTNKITINLPSDLQEKFDKECSRLEISYEQAIKNLINEWVS